MPIYLDHAATTPMRPEAIAAYVDALQVVGNPASIHSQGQAARRLLEESREQVAATLGCDPIEVVFTGNGTEAINLAIKGLFWARPGARILAPGGEHHATIDTVEWLERHDGAHAEWLPLDSAGRLRVEALQAALEEPASVALVTGLWANNEVGALQPVPEIAELCARAGVPLHLDAVAAYGHVPIDVAGLRARSGAAGAAGLVALSVSAHKIGGPVGIGALVLSRSAKVEPLIHGGGQQRQVRSGTQDVAAAAAFAAAARATIAERETEAARIGALRDRLVRGVLDAVTEATVNGPADAAARVPGTAHFAFAGCEGDSLLYLLDAQGIAVSTGSACTAGVAEASHVLIAMGRDETTARGTLRVSLGRTTTADEVDAFIAALPGAYAQASAAGLSSRATSFDR